MIMMKPGGACVAALTPVSYTHVDVYKRQLVDRVVNKMESRTMEFMDLLNEPAGK